MSSPRSPRSERGAAAVEFALVLPILLAIVLGIIDYGVYFSNSLATRQASRDGARQAVVGGTGYSGAGYTAPGFGSCSAPSTQTQQIACKTDALVGPTAGLAYSKVIVPGTWAKGSPLIVCTMVKTTGLTGFVPMPTGGYTKSKSQMSIENATAPSGGSYADPIPSDGSWSWCA